MVPNLMIGCGIDKVQAEYVAEIKLRHLNREYILRRTQETTDLEADIARPVSYTHLDVYTRQHACRAAAISWTLYRAGRRL